MSFWSHLLPLFAVLVLPAAIGGTSVGGPTEAPAPIEGWWSGEVVHNGQRTEIFLHLDKVKGGELTVSLTSPAIVGKVPLGHAKRTPSGIRIRSWELRCEEECKTLVGHLLTELVPLHRIAVRLHPSEGPPEILPQQTRPAPQPVWQVQASGAVWAPLEVSAAGLLFVATDAGSIAALNTTDGSVSWKRQLDAGIRAAPVVLGDTLAVHTDAESVYLLRASNGDAVWHSKLEAERRERLPVDDPHSRWDFFASTVVPSGTDLVVATRAGSVHALDAKSGTERWRIDVGDAVTGTPAVSGDRIVFGSFDGYVRAVSPETGSLLWERDLQAALPSDTVVIENRAWVGSRAYELHALDLADGRSAWSRYFWFSWVDSAPREYDGVGYIGSSDALLVQALSGTDGRPLWASRVPGWAWARPAVTSATVFAGTVGMEGYLGPRKGSLVALDRTDGSQRWVFPVAKPDGAVLWGIASAPAVQGHRVFAADLAGNIYAFDDNAR